MENYTITKEQILEIAGWANLYNLGQVIEWFPDAFKKEMEVGKWYKNHNTKIDFLLNYQGQKDEQINYGFWRGKWGEFYTDSLNYIEATDEEVEEALKNEVIKRFGKDWRSAKIEKCLVHGYINGNFPIGITTNEIWNKNGCIYENGVFAEPLKSKVITIEKAEKILSEKYGQKVEIK